MDFARKQLEKYGWSEGKGLGKHGNGMSEPLKPKIKRSVTGVGHDPASEFNEHWWSALYDKAAGNVKVQESNGKTKKIKTKGDLTITTNTWQISKGSKKEAKEQYSDFFVRTAVLTKGGNKVEKVKESDSEDEKEIDKKDVLKMTDEELFAACGGRTAHKGARHGLKATGKLARIAQQEAMLLSQAKYSGYSHTKIKEPIADGKICPEPNDTTERKKKKKKRKQCFSNGNVLIENCETDIHSPLAQKNSNYTDNITMEIDYSEKKSKKKNIDALDEDNKNEKKKKRRIQGEESMDMDVTEVNVRKKKQKSKVS